MDEWTAPRLATPRCRRRRAARRPAPRMTLGPAGRRGAVSFQLRRPHRLVAAHWPGWRCSRQRSGGRTVSRSSQTGLSICAREPLTRSETAVTCSHNVFISACSASCISEVLAPAAPRTPGERAGSAATACWRGMAAGRQLCARCTDPAAARRAHRGAPHRCSAGWSCSHATRSRSAVPAAPGACPPAPSTRAPTCRSGEAVARRRPACALVKTLAEENLHNSPARKLQGKRCGTARGQQFGVSPVVQLLAQTVPHRCATARRARFAGRGLLAPRAATSRRPHGDYGRAQPPKRAGFIPLYNHPGFIRGLNFCRRLHY